MNRQFDIAVIGGGPVGAALALALHGSRLRICVLEARPADVPSRDARALALSYGSRLLLSRLGIWDALQEISSIRTIHISQQRSFGQTLLHAEELDVTALGYVLPYPVLQHAMTQALHGSDIEIFNSAIVTQLDHTADHVQIDYQQDGTVHALQARLAVVADGGKLLEQKYPPAMHDYGQSALITHVTCAAPRAETAFERFTPQGPLALLPYKDGYELVWTAPHQRAQEMLQWDDAEFLLQLHAQFGDRVGEFKSAGTRACFPLSLKRALQQSPMPRTVLLGNAAQTMHPVAGQGFNLGLRDAWELAQVVHDSNVDALGSEAMLAAYRNSRRSDREAAIRFTDGLVRLFSNDWPLLDTARAAALTALDCLPFAKKFVARRMMFGANG
ncbi:MAG: FAD-dependent monooxygenase [Gallionella sp.]